MRNDPDWRRIDKIDDFTTREVVVAVVTLVATVAVFCVAAMQLL